MILKKHFNKALIVAISLFMAVSAILLIDGVSVLDAYAASLSKPSVTLSNASATSVKISWKKVRGAKKYNVMRSTKKTGGYKVVKTTSSLSYKNTGLKCGKTYYYKVKAVSGSKSSVSAAKSIKAKPKKVSGLKASPSCTSISLSWSKSSGVSGYEVFRATSSKGKFSKIKTTSSVSYKNTSLSFGKKCYYKVRAYKTVNGKKVYGSYSSVVNATTKKEHTPSTSWNVTKPATCAATGKKSNVCAVCGNTYYESIPKDTSMGHNYVSKKITVAPTQEYCGYTYTKYTCSICGKVTYSEKKIKEHKLTPTVKMPTATAQGYTTYSCERDGCDYSYKDDFVDATGDLNVCYIDLSEQSIKTIGKEDNEQNSDFAYYNETKTKLNLVGNGSMAFEIVGEASDLTIDVNAYNDTEIKLMGVTITNDAADCFDIKNKVTDENTAVPEVSISATVDTVNTLITQNAGNAIESSCELTLKGRGTLIMDTSSTSVNAMNKVNIKNLSLNIKSRNRGIDTKEEITVTDVNGNPVITSNFYNIKIGANATITILSADDGIRCKNMDIPAINIDENGVPIQDGTDVETVINITSTGGDGIQIEGNRGLIAASGSITIDAYKYAFNCNSELVVTEGATVNASGKTAIYKP